MNNITTVSLDLRTQADTIIKIRVFEETVLRLFSENKLSGTTHTYIGQEATAAAVMRYITENDKIFSNHRCHGHYIAYGGSRKSLLAEMMSKKSGICEGRGGSQHIHYHNFNSNGVQGGIVPNALGTAWADKLNKRNDITVVFLGDGTLGQGVVYESFNIASLYEIPVLFVIEDNQYAMSTHNSDAVSGTMGQRASAFGIEWAEITSNNIEVLNNAFEQAFSQIRKTGKPFFQIVHNYRLGPHSKGDDFRDKQEVESWREKDPINYLKEKFGDDYYETQKQKTLLEMEAIISELENEECISIADYHKSYKKLLAARQKPATFLSIHHDKVLTCIQASLDAAMNDNDRIIVIGEDICDPYGGAFKVTKNLSTKYPDRVVNTPISEAALVGTGIGLALNGMIPVVEIMFGDFISLCFDQLLNHAVKYSWVYGNGIKVPLMVRVPMGAGRGYGPTHSQSLEKFLTGIPLLSVMAISVVFDVKKLYEYALTTLDNPLIIIENKKMYGERVMRYENGKIGSFFVQEVCHAQFPSVKLSLDISSNADCILITYGGMVTTAMEAAETLMLHDEIQLDIVIITQLSPLPQSDLFSLITSDCVGTLEEGTLTNGIGSEIIAFLSEAGKGKNYFRIATDNIPIPNGNALEDQILPDKNSVADKIRSLYNGK